MHALSVCPGRMRMRSESMALSVCLKCLFFVLQETGESSQMNSTRPTSDIQAAAVLASSASQEGVHTHTDGVGMGSVGGGDGAGGWGSSAGRSTGGTSRELPPGGMPELHPPSFPTATGSDSPTRCAMGCLERGGEGWVNEQARGGQVEEGAGEGRREGRCTERPP